MQKPDPINILLVDDQPGKLLSYEAMLGGLGENLVKATSGREALSMLLKMDVAVILLDVNMPNMDGFETAEIIRGHPQFEKTPIIFVTAVHTTDIERLKGYGLGAVDYVYVPVVAEILRTKVSVFVELNRKTRELQQLNLTLEQRVADRTASLQQENAERKRMEEELRLSGERLAQMTRQLISAQETERRRLAGELHDELGQICTAIHIKLQQAKLVCGPAAEKHLDEGLSIVGQAIQRVREMSLDLRPVMLDDFGLVAALKWYFEVQTKLTGIPVDFKVQTSGAPLPPDVNNTCFRVVQESFTNINRHAHAQHVRVELHQDEDEVQLVIQDDGDGFDGESARLRAIAGHSMGLFGMQERVELLGGHFRVESHLKQGTKVVARMPLPETLASRKCG